MKQDQYRPSTISQWRQHTVLHSHEKVPSLTSESQIFALGFYSEDTAGELPVVAHLHHLDPVRLQPAGGSSCGPDVVEMSGAGGWRVSAHTPPPAPPDAVAAPCGTRGTGPPRSGRRSGASRPPTPGRRRRSWWPEPTGSGSDWSRCWSTSWPCLWPPSSWRSTTASSGDPQLDSDPGPAGLRIRPGPNPEQEEILQIKVTTRVLKSVTRLVISIKSIKTLKLINPIISLVPVQFPRSPRSLRPDRTSPLGPLWPRRIRPTCRHTGPRGARTRTRRGTGQGWRRTELLLRITGWLLQNKSLLSAGGWVTVIHHHVCLCLLMTSGVINYYSIKL